MLIFLVFWVRVYIKLKFIILITTPKMVCWNKYESFNFHMSHLIFFQNCASELAFMFCHLQNSFPFPIVSATKFRSKHIYQSDQWRKSGQFSKTSFLWLLVLRSFRVIIFYKQNQGKIYIWIVFLTPQHYAGKTWPAFIMDGALHGKTRLQSEIISLIPLSSWKLLQANCCLHPGNISGFLLSKPFSRKKMFLIFSKH